MKTRHYAVLAAATLGLAGCGFGIGVSQYDHEVVTDESVSQPVRAVDLSTDSGSVRIRPGDSVKIHRKIRYNGGRPHPTQQVTGGTLSVAANCSRCSIGYDITVPANTTIKVKTRAGEIDVARFPTADLETSAGQITASDIKGDVRAHTGSGTVRLDHVGGHLDAQTGAGSINAGALRSPKVEAGTRSGSVTLTFDTAPTDIRGTTRAGSITIETPGGPFAVDADSDSGGKPDISVQEQPSASSKIYLRTGSGSITVKPN